MGIFYKKGEIFRCDSRGGRMGKNRIIWCIMLVFIITSIMPTSAFAEVTKTDLTHEDFKIKCLETKNGYIYKQFEVEDDTDYTVSMTDLFFLMRKL